MAESCVLLHGFGGTHRTWDRVVACLDAERYLAPDLRGHGAAGDARPVTFKTCVDDVLAAAPERFALAGYSMGGRLALHAALAAPDRVARLVLVGTTAGIEDDGERARRRESDEELAAALERDGIEAFADRWAAQPLFANDRPDIAAEARADQLRNEAAGLAASLRGVGTGRMTPVWDRLSELGMPAVVLAGERDAKFTALGARLAAALPDARLVVVGGSGHRVHLEAPADVAAALVSGAE